MLIFQGIFSENKDKLITAALQALVQKEGDQKTVTPVELEAQFQALRRLVANKVGYAAFTSLPGLVIRFNVTAKSAFHLLSTFLDFGKPSV